MHISVNNSAHLGYISKISTQTQPYKYPCPPTTTHSVCLSSLWSVGVIGIDNVGIVESTFLCDCVWSIPDWCASTTALCSAASLLDLSIGALVSSAAPIHHCMAGRCRMAGRYELDVVSLCRWVCFASLWRTHHVHPFVEDVCVGVLTHNAELVAFSDGCDGPRELRQATNRTVKVCLSSFARLRLLFALCGSSPQTLRLHRLERCWVGCKGGSG